LLKAGEVVPTSRLRADLWPDEEPPMSARTVRSGAIGLGRSGGDRPRSGVLFPSAIRGLYFGYLRGGIVKEITDGHPFAGPQAYHSPAA
jgi:hypothetical protein